MTGGLNRMIFKIPSNPNCSMILLFLVKPRRELKSTLYHPDQEAQIFTFDPDLIRGIDSIPLIVKKSWLSHCKVRLQQNQEHKRILPFVQVTSPVPDSCRATMNIGGKIEKRKQTKTPTHEKKSQGISSKGQKNLSSYVIPHLYSFPKSGKPEPFGNQSFGNDSTKDATTVFIASCFSVSEEDWK
ncbi:hypothetical protein WISP_28598 [Willisornis vidua]|uniref:Uncharacterized protein n=1 Tax=Willisornis vidua TaxID=1566151 RepID=A0ABQ9DRF7_9PASS|nr:hypothetical protein WISP_28598 [Willisornis vidua]